MAEDPTDWVPEVDTAQVAGNSDWVPASDDAFVPEASKPRSAEDIGEIRATTTGERVSKTFHDIVDPWMSPGMNAPPRHVPGVQDTWSDLPMKAGEWVAEQATSPLNLLLAGIGPIASGTTAAARFTGSALKVLSAGFSTQMTYDALKNAPELYKTLSDPDASGPKRVEAATQELTNILFARLARSHALSPDHVSTPSVATRAGISDQAKPEFTDLNDIPVEEVAPLERKEAIKAPKDDSDWIPELENGEVAGEEAPITEPLPEQRVANEPGEDVSSFEEAKQIGALTPRLAERLSGRINAIEKEVQDLVDTDKTRTYTKELAKARDDKLDELSVERLSLQAQLGDKDAINALERYKQETEKQSQGTNIHEVAIRWLKKNKLPSAKSEGSQIGGGLSGELRTMQKEGGFAISQFSNKSKNLDGLAQSFREALQDEGLNTEADSIETPSDLLDVLQEAQNRKLSGTVGSERITVPHIETKETPITAKVAEFRKPTAENSPEAIAEKTGYTNMDLSAPENSKIEPEVTPLVDEEQPMEASGPTHGIAARVSKMRSEAGLIEEVEPGVGISTEDSIARGKELLSKGADPKSVIDQFDKDQRISSDAFAVVRAESERLYKEAIDAAEKYGPDSDEYKKAEKADSDWVQRIKPMQTEWAKIGQAQQGEVDINTGSFHALSRSFKESTGRDLDPKQAEKAKEIAAKSKKASDEASQAIAKVFDEILGKPAEKAPRRTSRVTQFITEQAAAARERIKARSGEGRQMAGLDPQDLADHAIIGAEYLAKGINDFEGWSKSMLGEFGDRIKPHLDAIFDAAKSKLTEFNDARVAKALESRKAALETSIEKLTKKISEGDLSTAAKKSSRPEIQEVESLLQEKEKLSAELQGMRDRDTAIKDLQESIAEKDKKIQEGDISTKKQKVNRPAEAEIEKLKQRRDEQNRKIAEMRKENRQDAAGEKKINSEISRLEKSIARKEQKLKTGDLSGKPVQANRPSIEAIEKLKQDRDLLNKKLSDARKERDKMPDGDATKRRVDAINKQIEQKRKMIDSGNIEAKKQALNRPEVKEVEVAKQNLDKVNNELAEARKAAKQDLKTRQENKVQNIWKRAKDYVDSGETDFDAIRHKISVDTGLSVDEVSRLLAEPKSMRVMTDDMYAKMANRRAVTNSAKSWLKDQESGSVVRFMKKIPRVFFTAKVFGHGTVGMITHGGINIFHPDAWATYFPNFARQFKLMGLHDKGAFHERMMKDLENDPNYNLARRAGLGNDTKKYVDDYQSGQFTEFLAKYGLTGARGFDALKLFRQDRFNEIWEKQPASMKTLDNAKLIADGINHATGYVKQKFPEWTGWSFFAPKLEGSRWAWMIGDPIKAQRIFSNWEKSTPAERQFAIRELKQKATMAGVYMSLLAINQGALSASGSDQKINFTNPRRGDFLTFKGGGYQFGVVTPMLGLVRLFANLAHASVGKRSSLESLTSRSEEIGQIGASYARGKLSPFGGVTADIVTQSDYAGRPLPYAKDKVPRYLRKEGVKKYTYGEYALENLSPIPASEAIKEVWSKQEMDESTQAHYLKALTSAVVMGSTGARMSKDTHLKGK